ncbi:zinc-dependent alcohol dehydrogenase [Faecalicatena contorta]|uniref:L-iditol 2-dehydrogenase n=1 Tax=Faecalicatena contorta TaxID=39482 RepID=A0A315ZN72_9FIRM|nr:alcohol dehydrogenase catalytic domain-containing protein [Faecalicatena contorta]PWJ46450.1 L-iditol 2-dehydrogenase [Faecalicatena contorta]SUQ16362.1 L-iditol 2-dehydrogenase [Faecalicatena contorta]
MRVVYVKSPFQFDIRETEIPEPGENQVLLDVRACAVCGTDMHTAESDADIFQSFGHEIAGVVVKNGPGSNRFRQGDKVVIESGTFCHVCENCRNGRPDLCTNGLSILEDVEISGYADYMLVPEQAMVAFDGLDFKEAALAEPLGVALDLFYTTGIEVNDDVAVVGLGPIGLMAIALAKAAGARNIYAIQGSGRSKARIELAKKLGATDVILTSETELARYTFPRGGVNKIMITAAPAVIPDMMKIAAYGGIIGFLGIDLQHGDITFNANDFHFRKLQLRASYAVPALWFPRALDLLKSKVVDPEDFITQTFPLEEIETYFTKQKNDSSDVIKMVMVKAED